MTWKPEDDQFVRKSLPSIPSSVSLGDYAGGTIGGPESENKEDEGEENEDEGDEQDEDEDEQEHEESEVSQDLLQSSDKAAALAESEVSPSPIRASPRVAARSTSELESSSHAAKSEQAPKFQMGITATGKKRRTRTPTTPQSAAKSQRKDNKKK